jgi:hypothetical protein
MISGPTRNKTPPAGLGGKACQVMAVGRVGTNPVSGATLGSAVRRVSVQRGARGALQPPKLRWTHSRFQKCPWRRHLTARTAWLGTSVPVLFGIAGDCGLSHLSPLKILRPEPSLRRQRAIQGRLTTSQSKALRWHGLKKLRFGSPLLISEAFHGCRGAG